MTAQIDLTAQIVFKAPPDVVVHGTGFSTGICGTKLCIVKNVSPGHSVALSVPVTSLKAGEYIVSADLIWYYEGEQAPHIKNSSCAVKFFAFAGGTPPPTKIPPHPLIVLTAIIAIVVIMAIVVRVLFF